MAQTSYSGTVYTHESNVQVVGLPLIFATNAKAPAIAKRIFDKYNDANDYISNSADTACAGLLLTVTGDTNTKNGLYTVMSGGTAPTGLELKRASGALTIDESPGATSGILKTYTFSTNGQEIGKIDIPKDFLVKSVSSYTITTQEQATETGVDVGHTCLDFVVNVKADVEGHEEQDQHTYIDLTETLSLHLDASGITATEISATEETVAITGNTVAQQLQSIGIQIKNHRGRVSSSGQTAQILHLYDDGIGIVSGATWDCGEWQ